jgi:NAD(P)-dependent dehydrogenase (short-subunit alcohol dehydrogenase family)
MSEPLRVTAAGARALVTGANRGIGRAFVEELLARGAARIYAAARDPDTLVPLVALDRERVRPIRLDVTDPAQVAAAGQAAADVSILVNNAGVLSAGGALEVSEEDLRRDMEVNYFGLLRVTRAFVPALERNRGGILNLLSVVSLVSLPGFSGYNASKAAAWSLTQSLRADLRKRGVAVVGIYPGPIDTDMAKSLPMDKASPRQVARESLDGLETGAEDVFPDPMSKQTYASWKTDHKAVERQFGAM